MINALAHIIDVHAKGDVVYTPLNVGLDIDQEFVAPQTSITQIFFKNDYVIKNQGNEATNANGVCE
jgi:hypothetical protein